MKRVSILMCLFSIIFCLVFLIALTQGAVKVSFATIWAAFFQFDRSDQLQQVIRNIRLPRVLASFIVGSCFAATGALMQGITRNSLADSGLLGINSGASLGLALAFILFPHVQANQAALFSFLGALVATSILFLISRYSKLGLTPVGLILSGVAISSFFSSISQALSLSFDLNQDLAFWFVGGVANVTWPQLRFIAPFYFVGIVLVGGLGKSLNVLAMGDDTAIALGKHPQVTRVIGLATVVLLAGMAVSLVGPVSFIGLMVPHIIRSFVGKNYRLVLPLSLFMGGLFVMLADVVSRLINPPFETPFGIVIAIIGVPFLLFQIRRTQI